ncbi:cytochrome c [Pelagibacterium montanilacus]|uniref:cytochrome c n=1 Tax=Pelagibacterium montanilacus TaxID=2185280 RepID=UPI000F8EC5D4|nr:cytochrome c [Pelagibacterium montanilacus]
MSRKPKIWTLVLAASLAIGAGSPVLSQGEDEVAQRTELMRSNGMTLRGAADATGQDAVVAAQTFVENFTILPNLFENPETLGETLPAAFENREAFLALFDDALVAAEAALAAADVADQEGYVANISAVGATCRACHGQFRAD